LQDFYILLRSSELISKVA